MNCPNCNAEYTGTRDRVTLNFDAKMTESTHRNYCANCSMCLKVTTDNFGKVTKLESYYK